MPIYEYHCDGCGLPFSTRRPVEQRDDVECPQCELRVRRLLSRVQIQTPAHFQMTRGWHLPKTKAGHEQLEANLAKVNPPEKPVGYREFVEERLQKERRLTLAG